MFNLLNLLLITESKEPYRENSIRTYIDLILYEKCIIQIFYLHDFLRFSSYLKKVSISFMEKKNISFFWVEKCSKFAQHGYNIALSYGS